MGARAAAAQAVAAPAMSDDGTVGGGVVLVTLALLLALHNANRFGITALFGPLRARYRGAYATAGNLFSAYPLAYACSQIPVGALADRVDPRRLIVTGTAGATVAGVLAGVASSMTTAPMMVFAGERFGAGSALAGVVFGPLLDATGSFAAIWWSCIPVGIARVVLLWMIGEEPRRASREPAGAKTC